MIAHMISMIIGQLSIIIILIKQDFQAGLGCQEKIDIPNSIVGKIYYVIQSRTMGTQAAWRPNMALWGEREGLINAVKVTS